MKDVNLVIHVGCPLNGLQSIWVLICVVFGFLFQNKKFAQARESKIGDVDTVVLQSA